MGAESEHPTSLLGENSESPSNVAALVDALESLPMSREMIEVEDWDEVGYEVAIATVDGPARIEIRESDSPVFQGTGDKESEFHPEVTVLDPPRRFLVVDLAIDGRRVTMEVDLGYVGDADEIMRLWPERGARMVVFPNSRDRRRVETYRGDNVVFEDFFIGDLKVLSGDDLHLFVKQAGNICFR